MQQEIANEQNKNQKRLKRNYTVYFILAFTCFLIGPVLDQMFALMFPLMWIFLILGALNLRWYNGSTKNNQ